MAAARWCRARCGRVQVEAVHQLAPCLIGIKACVGAHHLSRKLKALGHDAPLMPAEYVRPYRKGQKNDFRDAEAIAEAVQRPTMKFVATKTAEHSGLLPYIMAGSPHGCSKIATSVIVGKPSSLHCT